MPGPRFDSWWGNEDPARYAAQPPGPQKKKKKKNPLEERIGSSLVIPEWING